MSWNSQLEIETNLPSEIHLSNPARYLIEGWIFGTARLKTISATIGPHRFSAALKEMPRPDVASRFHQEYIKGYALFSGFSIPVVLETITKNQEELIWLEAKFRDGKMIRRAIGTVKMKVGWTTWARLELPAGMDEEELLVVCMATYNPALPVFQRQVESIKRQDYTRWLCLVCDDCSSQETIQMIRDVLGNDSRFHLIENEQNVGFYYNFEHCLAMVPPQAKYVALADQDDEWQPNKLSRCLDRLKGSTQLVYCDMKIVDPNGEVLAETYWKNRKNYYRTKDLDLLVLANTVTGAASVFRAELLKVILPFPHRCGHVFHDQWIAVMAAACGGIEYVDAPLYNYIQYGNNIIGHSDFHYRSLKDNFIWLAWRYRESKPRLREILFNAYMFMHREYKHVMIIAETAKLRKISSGYRRIRRPLHVFGLLKMILKIQIRRETTNNLEFKLLISKVLNLGYPFFLPLLLKYRIKKSGK